MTDDEHIKWLEEKLDKANKDLEKANAIIQENAPLVAHIQGLLTMLKAKRAPQSSASDTLSKNSQSYIPFARQVPNIPNKSEALRRSARYSNTSVVDAAKSIMETVPTKEWHVHELAPQIYEVSREDRKAWFKAVHQLSSEMIRGSNRGLWRKLGGNRFGLMANGVRPPNA
jgi:hypothetical protein